jgi:hypothetical protein
MHPEDASQSIQISWFCTENERRPGGGEPSQIGGYLRTGADRRKSLSVS